MDHLSRVHVVKVGDNWRLAECVKKTRDLAAELGLELVAGSGLLPKL